MKTIKKVAVTPVTPNTGDIIDSFNTSDDKHTNAPSINAVNNKFTEVENDIDNIEDNITEIEEKFDKLIKVWNFSTSSSTTLNSNSSADIIVDMQLNNYTLIGIRYINTEHSANELRVVSWGYGNGVVSLTIENISSHAITFNTTVTGVYIKTEVI